MADARSRAIHRGFRRRSMGHHLGLLLGVVQCLVSLQHFLLVNEVVLHGPHVLFGFKTHHQFLELLGDLLFFELLFQVLGPIELRVLAQNEALFVFFQGLSNAELHDGFAGCFFVCGRFAVFGHLPYVHQSLKLH